VKEVGTLGGFGIQLGVAGFNNGRNTGYVGPDDGYSEPSVG